MHPGKEIFFWMRIDNSCNFFNFYSLKKDESVGEKLDQYVKPALACQVQEATELLAPKLDRYRSLNITVSSLKSCSK